MCGCLVKLKNQPDIRCLYHFNPKESSAIEIKVKGWTGGGTKVLKPETYDGKVFKTYYDTYDVIQMNGDRVVIGIGKTVTAAVKPVLRDWPHLTEQFAEQC